MKNKEIFSLIFLMSYLFIATSCSPKLNKETSINNPNVFYPPEKKDAKIQYLTGFNNSFDIEPKMSGFKASIIGEVNVEFIPKPYGVFAKKDKIFTVGVSSGSIICLDLKEQKYKKYQPQGIGRIGLGLNMFVDSNEQIHVADAKYGQIKYYNAKGEFIGIYGAKENTKPTDVFVKNGKIWVCDSKSHRINIYDEKTLEFLDYFPKVEKETEGYLYTPTNIFVADEQVYVTDMGANCFNIYNHDGTFVKSVGSIGVNPGQFSRPKGLAADRENNIYVVDGSFQNIQIFNKKGELLLYFGGGEAGPGGMNLPTDVYIDYENNAYFEKYVDPSKQLIYIILVANQFGENKISVYGRIEEKVNK